MIIDRSIVLKELDFKHGSDLAPKVFSIKFIEKTANVKYIAQAVSCGLAMNMTKNKYRGVQQVDDSGNNVGHPVPVHVDSIIAFNNNDVKL